MSAPGLAVVPGRLPDDRPGGWERVLRASVRPQFRVDVYVAQPGDPVLFGPSCVVAGCRARGLRRADGLRGHLCDGHARMWRRDGLPPQAAWLKDGARELRHRRLVAACAVTACARSVHQDKLCRAHRERWVAAGKPPLADFAGEAAAVRTGVGECRVTGCAFVRVRGGELCDAHHRSYAWLRWRRGGLEIERFLAHVEAGRERSAPRFDLRGVSPVVALELGYALQCRHDQRGAAITPLIYGQVLRWLRDRPIDSVLIGSDTAWAAAAEQRFAKSCRGNPLAWVRFCRSVLGRLRDERQGGEVWEWDTWPTSRIDPDGRYAHQPTRRIYFADIQPGWLRELAKRWARWRITTTTKSPASVAVSTSSLRRFTTWLADRAVLPAAPSAITRTMLEDYRAHVHTLPVSAVRRNGLLTDLKVFLDDVRLHDWAPGLPANATYYRGEIPRAQKALPRFVDEFVMGQLQGDEALDRLPDLTTRTAVVILIETGLRSVDCLRLPLDPITTDEASAPYLRFFNHKASKDAVIPISDRVLAQIRRQQDEFRDRYATAPRFLLPAIRKNPDGQRALSWSTLNRRLARWLSDGDVRDAAGRPVKITAHQFRHTVGTRMINNEVPLDIVQRMLDHGSPEMTARYATIKDQTLRREWERFQQRVDIRGELIPLPDTGAMSDAAWALENLARAKQTLPNGYCGLPLQQTCPHPNACLTCDSFLTTAEFLPQHREQLSRTERLIAEAQADGRHRLVEINEPVKLNLLRIIDGLQSLEEDVDGR